MKGFDQQVADWARTKPADEAYDYGDYRNCALCQFLKENGFAADPRVGGLGWRDGNGPRTPYSIEFAMALLEYPTTFGALADRLSS